MKIVDPPKQQSMTPREAQALLLTKGHSKLKVTLEMDGGNYELTLDQLDALGLILNDLGILKHKTDTYGAIKVSTAHKGEVLVSGSVAIAATTVVYSTWFETKGYKHLFLVVTNAIAWSTNPTSIGLGIQFTHDDGTTKYVLRDSAAAVLNQALNPDDATVSCYFLTTQDYNEAVGSAPFPNTDDTTKIRLVFTPVGTAESQSIGYKIYGLP